MKIFYGTLTKISKNQNALRTPDMEGFFSSIPEVGNSFTIMNNEPIVKENNTNRIITTSRVISVDRSIDGVFIFDTMNSTYRLDLADRGEIK